MKLIRYQHGELTGIGVEVDGGVVATGHRTMLDVIQAGSAGLEAIREMAGRDEPMRDVRVLTPIPNPGKVLCCGVNYLSHKEENPTATLPTEPFFFSKLPSAVIGPDEAIVIPTPESQVDWEVELAFVVGKTARRVAAADALDHVFGYTILHDVSARDVQFKDSQITLGKGFDTFSPIGPCVTLKEEIPDPQTLGLATYLNDEQVQHGSTADQLFPVANLIEFLTRHITLYPGDIVSTGTPAGVGFFWQPPRFLRPGDRVVLEIERIGRLANPVVAGW